MFYIVLKIETHEFGNELINAIECIGIFHVFEDALKAATPVLRDGHDVLIEQAAA